MVKKKKVSKPKPKVVKAKKENFFLEDAESIEKDMMDKGSVKLNKDLKKVW